MGAAASTASTSEASLRYIYDAELERQIALQTIQFEEKQAIKCARSEELFPWQFLACTTTATGIIVYAQKTHNRFLVVPIVPLVMYIGYRYDQLFGHTPEETRKEAERLLKTEPHRFTPIGGPITLAELDRRRAAWHQPKLESSQS
uniref:Plasminogen receptor (KT) n=1 Tax=Panagrellus redivivus TaxID=6233 RepID=A0A7E4ZR56_PANRE